MDIEHIRELIRLMVDNDLAELDITDGESKIKLRRGTVSEASGMYVPLSSSAAAVPPVQPAQQVGSAKQEAETASKAEEELIEITSPMVGTFYAAPSPDSDPYVTVGSTVGEDTVVCIVEAMKVMNEIKAGCRGTIAEICVKNAQPVEFGQVLFKVKPS
ncbi:MAG: acetyl-CoA carboxylase biotin carboxyl carrier protein [Planctomycetes bacterium]|nr:acetyl-CoA carboxylase biotin carboxyl carrier protein [Planctomycetota bacterium]